MSSSLSLLLQSNLEFREAVEMGLLIEVEVVGLLLESIKERFMLDIHIWRKDLRKQWHFGRAWRNKRTILTVPAP